MKKTLLFIFFAVFLSCTNDTIKFKNQTFEQKSTLPCKEICTHVSIQVPEAEEDSDVSDSIYSHVLNVVKEAVYFGDNPEDVVDYDDIMKSFIQSYDQMQQQFPGELIGWEATVTGKASYQSDELVGIQLEYYNFTGGAHGYSGLKSLLISKEDGKLLSADDLFKDKVKFQKFAEKKFRETFKIPANHTINATGFMFEEDKFRLPNNIIFTPKGIILYFNVYEIASYVEGPKQLFMTFDEVNDYLKIK